MIRVANISLSNGIWSVKVGRQVEYIDSFGKTPGELFDAVRWALISKGVVMEEVDVVELMQKEKTE